MIAYGLYNKTCLKRPLIIDKTKVLKTDYRFIKVESIAECSPLVGLQFMIVVFSDHTHLLTF